jgi:hypothetical protein
MLKISSLQEAELQAEDFHAHRLNLRAWLQIIILL